MADRIPMGPEDLPIESTPLDDSLIYTGVIRAVNLSPKLDKRGNNYFSVQCEVLEPDDFAGKTVMHQYIPVPVELMENDDKATRMRKLDSSVSMGRFCKAFDIKNPGVVEESGPERWNAILQANIGNVGKFSVRNQEFPEGSGRIRSSINDFVF
jgi:hypothetical protein